MSNFNRNSNPFHPYDTRYKTEFRFVERQNANPRSWVNPSCDVYYTQPTITYTPGITIQNNIPVFTSIQRNTNNR